MKWKKMNAQPEACSAVPAEPAAQALPAFSAIGIELEYMLVDHDSLVCLAVADRVLQSGGEVVNEIAWGELAWSNEFFRHVIELKNPRPTADLQHLQRDFQNAIQKMNRDLMKFNTRLMPGSMHPWMDPATESQPWRHGDTNIYDTYRRIFPCRTHGWANLQSMHINLPFANDEEFARLHAAVRLILPLIPALAASSPIADGRDTGYADFRLRVYRDNASEFPSVTGALIPESVSTESEYRKAILAPMYREIAHVDPAGILQHEWLNSRGAIPRFDRHAIEIRVTDTQECPQADLAVATAIIHAAKQLYAGLRGTHLVEDVIPTRDLATILQHCVREGQSARIEHAAYLRALGMPETPINAAELWRQLLEFHSDDIASADPAWRDIVDFILEHGNLSQRILRAVKKDYSRDNLRRIYGELCDCLHDGRMFLGGSLVESDGRQAGCLAAFS
jgi:gamma-glutamyl:cysteine ligase YbdK (ATP-grasp superfamily)